LNNSVVHEDHSRFVMIPSLFNDGHALGMASGFRDGFDDLIVGDNG
jgi:hypothetical protein